MRVVSGDVNHQTRPIPSEVCQVLIGTKQFGSLVTTGQVSGACMQFLQGAVCLGDSAGKVKSLLVRCLAAQFDQVFFRLATGDGVLSVPNSRGELFAKIHPEIDKRRSPLHRILEEVEVIAGQVRSVTNTHRVRRTDTSEW